MKLNPAELQPIWNQVQGYLTNFAADPAFSTKMQQAFGPGNFDALQMAWAQGNLGVLPAVEVRPATDINGANGAFAGATNTIYLSQEFYDQNEGGGNDRPIAEVVLEEYGHYLDGQLDSLDSPGDEGDIFARLARGQLLTQPELSALQAEDDKATITLNGEVIEIEQADSSESDSKIPVYVFYINGINTTRAVYNDTDWPAVENLVSEAIGNEDQQDQFELKFQRNERGTYNLSGIDPESTRNQAIQLLSFLRELDLFTKGYSIEEALVDNLLNFLEKVNQKVNPIAGFLADIYQSLIQTFSSGSTEEGNEFTNRVINQIQESYNNEKSKAEEICCDTPEPVFLIVSHSQGNFFAEDIAKDLPSEIQENTKILGISPFTNFSEINGPVEVQHLVRSDDISNGLSNYVTPLRIPPNAPGPNLEGWPRGILEELEEILNIVRPLNLLIPEGVLLEGLNTLLDLPSHFLENYIDPNPNISGRTDAQKAAVHESFKAAQEKIRGLLDFDPGMFPGNPELCSSFSISDVSVTEGDEPGASGEAQAYFRFNDKFYEWEDRLIREGDILSQIALETLGTASEYAFKFIAFQNNISNPDIIRTERVIQVPKQVELPDTDGFAVFDIAQDKDPISVKINYRTANGSAISGSDYIGTSGQLSIPARQGGVILVPIVGDTTEEETESFQVILTKQDGTPFVEGGVSTLGVTGTIIDNDGPPDPPEGGRGGSTGDPHLVTFDGLKYDFQAAGEFTLLKSESGDLEIQVRQEPLGSSLVAINTAVATTIDGQRVGLYLGQEQPLLIDGTPTAIPDGESLALGEAQIYRKGGRYTIIYPSGDHLVVNVQGRGWMDVNIFLSEGREGAVSGLFGNNNDTTEDDIAQSDGTVISQPISFNRLYSSYADSWRITQEESLFDYEPGEDTSTFTDRNFPSQLITIDDLDPAERLAAEEIARAAGITDPILLEDAILDIVISGNPDFALAALNAPIPQEAITFDSPPKAFDDFASTIVETPVTLNVIANDIRSSNGLPLVLDSFDRTSREGGSISLDDSGTPDDPTDDQLVFTPPADFSGFDLFKYTVSDGTDTDTARVTVIVPQLNLSDIDGSNGFVLNGINIDDFSGLSVSEVGDINNDGIEDLIVGAPLADPNSSDNVGSSYVVFGSTEAFPASFDLSQLNGSNGFVINGIEADSFSGSSVSGVRDINDDGIDDLLVGAFGAAPNENDNAGSSYVIFGSNEAFPASFDLSQLNGSNGFVIDGNNELDHSGIAVSEAGDLNADGINDLLVSAPGLLGNGFGKNYAVFGRSEGFPASINPFDINGNNGFLLNDTDGNSGGDISSAGDINGDGIDDVIIGADITDPDNLEPVEGYVVFGSPGIFPPNVDLSNLNGSNGFVLDDGISKRNDSGTFVSGIGDINGDGLDDIAVADPNSNNSAGRVYVVFGSEEEFAASFDLFSLNGSNGFILNGIEAGDYAGISVSDAGDVNGDGFDDLIIGASNADIINEEETDGENQNVGRSFLIFGKEEFDATLNLSQLNGRNGLIINGVDPDERSGLAVSGAGDLNGDGIDDLAIGSPGSFFTESAGKTYILFGSEDFGKQNNPPETASDRATTARNTPVSIDVLANDRDIDDDILRVLNFTAPSNGSLGLDNNGTFRDISDDRLIYSPNPGFIGRDSFEYRIDDGNGGTETGTVEVTVTSEIGAPPKPTLTVIRGTSSDDSLTGTEENNVILGFQGNDFLNGLSGDDVLFAGEGADTLTGGIGNDILYGDNGNDLLNGGPGDDTLTGGSGRDILQGGVGSDVFVLSTSTAVPGRVEADVIPFFEVGVDAIGLIVGVIEEDLTLEARGTNTIVKLGESDEILGIVSKVTPEELEGSFVPVNIDLF